MSASRMMVWAWLLGACHMDQRFVSPEGGGPYRVAIAEDTPAFFSSDELTVFVVETRIELPLRAPNDAELASLTVDDGQGFGPFPRRPWVSRHDYEAQVDFVISNLDQEAHVIAVTWNGINEFHEYTPGVNAVGDDVLIDFAGWERSFTVPAGGRVSGTIREEEIDEVTVDLATVVNGAPNSNQVVYWQNQSDHDERSRMYIPVHVPALVGARLGLRLESEGEMAAPIALEATVHVRDVRNRLVDEGETGWTLPMPAAFVPVVPEDL